MGDDNAMCEFVIGMFLSEDEASAEVVREIFFNAVFDFASVMSLSDDLTAFKFVSGVFLSDDEASPKILIGLLFMPGNEACANFLTGIFLSDDEVISEFA